MSFDGGKTTFAFGGFTQFYLCQFTETIPIYSHMQGTMGIYLSYNSQPQSVSYII